MLEFEGYRRKFVTTAMDLNTGNYVSFDENSTPINNIHQVTKASGSTSLLFRPHKFNNTWYMDVGSAWGVNVAAAISKCHEIVDDPSKITIDTGIFCDDPNNTD